MPTTRKNRQMPVSRFLCFLMTGFLHVCPACNGAWIRTVVKSNRSRNAVANREHEQDFSWGCWGQAEALHGCAIALPSAPESYHFTWLCHLGNKFTLYFFLLFSLGGRASLRPVMRFSIQSVCFNPTGGFALSADRTASKAASVLPRPHVF